MELEGMVPYGHLLLAPVEGWWPSATWRALQALWIAVKKKIQGAPKVDVLIPKHY